MKIEEVKKVIAYKTLVSYKGISYTVNAVSLRIKDKEFFYTLELQDLKANSVMNAFMKDVEVKDELLS